MKNSIIQIIENDRYFSVQWKFFSKSWFEETLNEETTAHYLEKSSI